MSNYNLLNTHLSIGKSYRPSPLDQIGVLKLTRYSFLSSVYILKVLYIPPHKLKDIYPVGGWDKQVFTVFWLPQPPTILFFAFYPSDRQLLMSDREGDERRRESEKEKKTNKRKKVAWRVKIREIKDKKIKKGGWKEDYTGDEWRRRKGR